MNDQQLIEEMYPGDGPKATMVLIIVGGILMMIGVVMLVIGSGIGVNYLINLITKP